MTRYWIAMALGTLAAALLLFGILRLIDAARSEPVASCFTVDEQKHIRAMSAAALDDAFRAQVANLFNVWMKDYSPEPKRAAVGMNNAINAHQRAQAWQWNPTTCQ